VRREEALVTTIAFRAVAAAAVTTLAVGLVAACSSGGGRTAHLTWYINPDNGGQAILARECSAASNGAYSIKTSILPNDASQQRQQLVTRLAAKDSSIDLMSLDPVFVAEFAEAGFLTDVPAQDKARVTENIVAPAVQASTWKDRLVAVPFWANTQLLWFRKSLAEQAGLDMSRPVTWDQIVAAAQKLHKTVGVQADLYEGYTVWINALVEGAGGRIVDNPGAVAKDLKLGLDSPAGVAAATVIQEVVRAGVGGPSLSTNEESQALALFEKPATSAFLVNWPYTWAQMGPAKGSDNISFRDTDVGWTRYPQTIAGKESKPPFGGIELGIGRYGKHPAAAFDAAMCITSDAHQKEYMLGAGNPAANRTVYDDPEVQKQYPMADTIRQSLDVAAPRPQSQYYGDLSTALQKSFSPPSSVRPNSTPRKAAKFILEVLKGDKLL
jgi:multiple sugar transport system substrate-binding protein